MNARLILLALSFGLAFPAIAQDQEPEPPPEFDIELIIFRPLTPDDSEPPIIRLEEENSGEPAIQRRRYAPLTAEQLRLKPISDKLLGSKDWSPILHYGWRQPVLGREDGASVAIAGNRRGAFATGDVRLTVERFLRLELNLQMDPGTGLVYTMEQSRRIRSGQLHYFDHPQFGMIVLVSRPE